jgi:hypothetical protein
MNGFAFVGGFLRVFVDANFKAGSTFFLPQKTRFTQKKFGWRIHIQA